MKRFRLFSIGGLIIVALLLFIFSVYVHHQSEAGEFTSSPIGSTSDKISSLKLGRSFSSLSQRKDQKFLDLSSIPNLLSIPMFMHLNRTANQNILVEKSEESEVYENDDPEGDNAEAESSKTTTLNYISKLRNVLFHSKERDFVSQRSLHPAVPDPKYEPEPTETPMSCRKSYEPKCPMYNYVRFWNKRFYPQDCYSSPMRHPMGKNAPMNELKYLVFEPDRGGWNNIRMAAETAMIFAHATGRVLVMPPKLKMYLLDKDQHEEENESTFSKFFDLEKLSESITIMTMESFLEQVAKPGLLNAPLPAKYTAQEMAHVTPGSERLWKYLEQACYTREWEPGKMHIGFNLTYDRTSKPIFGRINLIDPRVKKHASHNRKLVPYDAKMHVHRAIYFPGDYRNTHRILTHFYSYLYWADLHTEHIYKRLVRDRLHYHDDIFCAAGRVVRMLHEDAAALSDGKYNAPTQRNSHPLTMGGDTNKDATYFAYHIRRGDFQYKHTKLSAKEIWSNTKHLLAPSMNRTSLIYIATDEKNKAFFDPFKEGFAQHNFKLVFLSDYIKRAFLGDGHLNQNHIGMVEQVICANAHTFIGTPLSTFTGYITRMRGYYRDGRYARTYYTMPQDMYQLHKKPELVGPFWAREFAVAHRDIDDIVASSTV